jgi:DNA polymerase III epsilon subunit-like protein
MAKVYSGLVNLNGNLMVSLDYETTGRRAGYHEIIQIGIVPLNSDLRPLEGIRPFYHTMKPMYPERQEARANYVHGLDINELVLHAPEPDRVKDLLKEWFQRLELPFNKVMVPLCHNWAFESAFTKAWLGVEGTDEIFHSLARDSMLYATSLNDKAAFAGAKLPFSNVGLKSLCRRMGITNPKPHDALCDALAEAELYRALLHIDLFN